tara:strand:- start:182 stop:769 length:588 start_codon:yes stop_codon:yes gene_type:complete
MAREKLSDELKRAIKELPSSEKDKLLLRLIPQNSLLVRQLEFKLLEESATTDTRKEELKENIETAAKSYPDYYYSPGYLMMHMRDMSGYISNHVSVTKDKVGEIELNLIMLVEFIGNNKMKLLHEDFTRVYKLNEYVIKRILKIFKLLEKIDEDYHIDFQENMQKIGLLIGEQDAMMRVAIQNGLDVNLLLNFNE